MKRIILSTDGNRAFECPLCRNNTLYCVDHDCFRPADVDYHELFVCDECGAELLSEPQYNGKIRFVTNTESSTRKKVVKSGTSMKRIARLGEFDNGHVLHGDWKKMTDEEAEDLARKKSKEDPSSVYYVAYDNIMNPSSDYSYRYGRRVDLANRYDLMKMSDEEVSAIECSGNKVFGGRVNWPFVMEAEFEDGYSATISGEDEDDCMTQIAKLTNTHGDATWYSGYNNPDEGYFDGQFDPDYEDYDDVMSGTSEKGSEEYEDDIQEIGQEFTSENTSINSGKLPAVFNMVSFEPGTVNLDYGGGRFDNVAEYLAPLDVINLVYDPYNRTKEHNQDVIKLIREHGGADTATCSNVLNVIKEPEVRLNVLKNINKLVKPSGTVYITVYEGSGKGNEGPTKAGYQLNRKTADYLEEIQQVFPDARRRGKLIVCHPGRVVESATSVTSSISSLKSEIEKTAKAMMMSPEFGFTNEDVDDYLRVDVNPGNDATHVEVGAEVSYDGLMTLSEALDKVIQKYDSDSYFEPVEPGIIEAFIRNVTSATNTANIAAGWNDPEPPLDPPEGPDYNELDPEEEYIELSIDDTLVVEKDGSFDFEDPKCAWADGDGRHNDHYSYEHDVYMDDNSGVVEKVLDLIESYVPADPGRYRVTCDVILAYEISGIETLITDAWFDEDHGYDYEEEVYTDNAEAEYLPRKSTVENFQFEKLQ